MPVALLCDLSPELSDGNCMWQFLALHRNMTFDTRDFLACVIALQNRRARVLHTLPIHDQEYAANAAPPFLSGRANLFF